MLARTQTFLRVRQLLSEQIRNVQRRRPIRMPNPLRLVLRKWTPTICVYNNPFKICEFWRVIRLLKPNPQGSLVDFGCGGGLQTVLLARKFHRVLGVDIDDSQFGDASQRLHRWNRNRIRFLCGDLLDLALPADSADAVVSFSVLEHVAGWEPVLVELFRLLKPGGQLVISVDSLGTLRNPELVERHMKAYSVQQYFSAADLGVALRKAGFRIVEVEPVFTSRLAERLFAQGIQKDFSFTRFASILNALRLELAEERCSSQAGIFLIANAIK